MDEVFNVIHQMQDRLEEDRAQFIEEEDGAVGEYSGKALDFKGNNDFKLISSVLSTCLCTYQ